MRGGGFRHDGMGHQVCAVLPCLPTLPKPASLPPCLPTSAACMHKGQGLFLHYVHCPSLAFTKSNTTLLTPPPSLPAPSPTSLHPITHPQAGPLHPSSSSSFTPRPSLHNHPPPPPHHHKQHGFSSRRRAPRSPGSPPHPAPSPQPTPHHLPRRAPRSRARRRSPHSHGGPNDRSQQGRERRSGPCPLVTRPDPRLLP